MSYGAITFFRRQYLRILRHCAFLNAMGMLGGVLLPMPGAMAADIVTDGRTQTNLSGSGGGVTDITTGTVRGNNAFNSFSRFNVGNGETVNLHLPTNTANLLNLVNGAGASNIDGVMNAYRDGRIGGNVFFFNPHGVVVGASGQINVGSLMLAAPTADFMNRLLSPQGAIDNAAVAQALAGQFPLSSTGLISVRGAIRTIDAAMLAAATVNIEAGGSVHSGPSAAVQFGALVNVDGLAQAGVTYADGDTIRILAAGDVSIAGTVAADGTSGQHAGNVDIRAGRDITLSSGARVSADGHGSASDAGQVITWADRNATLSQGATVSARGGEVSGDGGFVEFSAKEKIVLAGGELKVGANNGDAGAVLIDPNDIEVVANSQFTDGGAYTLIANNSITVAENVVISTRNTTNPTTDDHLTAASQGDSGNLRLKASHVELKAGSKLLAHADNGFAAGDITVSASHVNAVGADRTANASVKITDATIRGRNILIRSDADTSAIVQALDAFPNTSLADAQKLVDDEADSLSDGPGGEFLAVKTKATAKTEIYGARITGSGSVTIDSRAGARAGFKKEASADTIIGDSATRNTQISGSSVTIEAKSSTSFTLNVLGNLVRLADQSWLPDENDPTLQVVNDQLFDFSAIPLVALSTSTARVLVNGATSVTASDAININTEAVSAAKPGFSSPMLFSAAWGESTAEAKTQVLGTATLTSTNKTSVGATTDVELNVSADVNSTNKPIDAVFVRAKNTATALAETGDDTTINAGAIDVNALVKADITAVASARNAGGSGLGIAVAVNESDNTATARLGGDATATTGDVKANAKVDIAKNTTSADAATLGNPNTLSAKMTNFTAGIQRNVSGGLLTSVGGLSQANSDKLTGFMFPGIKEGKFNASGAVAYVDATNTANASIAANATVKANGKIDVVAKVEDRPTASAGAKSTSTGTAIGGSVVLGNFSNNADAFIGHDATVDARGALRVDAQTLVPFAWQIDWNSPDAILNHLQGAVLDLVFTSYSINSASGKSGLGLAAGVSLFNLDNHSNAHIDEGAKINTVYDKDSMVLPQQSVTVYAKNDVSTVNAVGILGKKFFGTSGGKAAIGGAVNIVDIAGTASATIRGNAQVKSENGVDVKAESVSQIVTVTEAGGQSDNVGIEGAVSINMIDNTTVAAIDDDARIDAGSNVQVQALGDVENIAIAGGVVATKGQVGIGFAVSINDIDTSTSAFVGDYDPLNLDNAAATGSVKTGGNLLVKAESDTEIGAYSVSGAIATNSSAQGSESGASGSDTKSGSSGSGTGKFGIAVSADASINEITADTKAYLSDGANVTQAGNVTLDADNTLAINALAGAVTISTQSNGNGLAGSFAMNSLGGTTAAYITDATIAQSGALSLDADVDGEIRTLSASVQGSKGKVGVAGSVSINDIANTTTAYLYNSNVSGVQGVTVSASDTSAIRAVAGAIAFGGKAGIGLSFAWNELDNVTSAYIQNSDVDASGALDVNATSDGQIDTIAASLGASSGQMAGAAAVAINEIDNRTNAYIDGKKTVNGIDAASLNVSATDGAGIFAVVGALGLSAGNAGFGVSFAWNDIDNRIGAELKNTHVDTGSVSLTAKNDSEIETYAMGGGGSAKVGVSGSLAINDITTQTQARSDNSTVLASGNVSIKATDEADILAVTGALSGGGTAAVGASGSYNHIGGSTLAEVSGGQIDSAASVTVEAKRSGTVDVWAAAGSGGGTAGFAGSIAINDLGGSTTARIGNGANVDADHNLLLTAQDDETIQAKAGTVALGGTVGGGGAIAVNDIHSSTTAEVTGSATRVDALGLGGTMAVDNGSLTAGGFGVSVDSRQQKDNIRGVAVVASSTSKVESILANVSGGGKAGVAATVSVNLLGGTTTAQVTGGARINESLAGANAQQQARVAAYHHDVVQAGAGGLAIGGAAGVGGSADSTIVSHTTTAKVDGATVQANNAVTVDAGSTVETEQIVVGAAGGGAAAVNISATVLSVNGTTQALAHNATLNSQGALTVEATSELDADHYVGGLNVSGAAGVGASVIVTVVDQTTRATTSGSTTLNANGATNVHAASDQDIGIIGATGSASGGVGIAGTVGVTIVKGSTEATVGGSTQINQDGSYAGSAQDVRVTASDSTSFDSKLGALGIGVSGGGVGATADVVLVNNGASATIVGGARVDADRDIVVDADATRDISSLTVAASGGLTFGISGAVSYIGVGSRAGSDAQSELSGSVNDASTVSSRSAFGDQSSTDAGGISGTVSRTNSARSGLNVANDFATLPSNNTAAAGVGSGAVLKAGRDVNVSATTQTDTDAMAIGAAVSGGVSLGGGIAIANVDDATLASVSGNVTANRNVLVSASDVQTRASSLQTYAGGAGLVGLGASVAIQSKTSSATAEIGNSAIINATGTAAADANGTGLVRVDAGIDHNLRSEALGGAAGIVGVGAALAYATEDGSATAQVGDNAQITGKALDVHGHAQTDTYAEATAAAGGLFSGAGADAKATDRSSAKAELGDNTTVRTTGGLAQIRADVDPVADARALGVAVSTSVSIGVSLAKAEVDTDADAITGNNIDVEAATLKLDAQTRLRGGDKTADASAVAAAGGALLGAGATDADAIANTGTRALIGNNAKLRTSDDVQVLANSATSSDARVTGVNIGLLAGGSNNARTVADTTTTAGIGNNADIVSTDEVKISATGSDTLRADTEAGAGGLGVLVASKAQTIAVSHTDAYLGSASGTGGSVTARELDIDAAQTTNFNATADSLNASVVGYSGARAVNNVDTFTNARIGNNLTINAQEVQAHALNSIVKPSLGGSYNVDSQGGGLLNGAAARSESTIRNRAEVSIGDGTDLIVNVAGVGLGVLNLGVQNTVNAHDSVRLDSGGAVAIARAESVINNDLNDGKVQVGSNATLLSDGEINLSARTVADVRTEARSKTYGVAGAAEGDTRSYIAADNQVNIGAGTLIESEKDVHLMSGTDRNAGNNLNADADTRLWNRTAVPIETDPKAHGEINQHNTINVAAGAQVRSVKSVYLTASEGTHTVRGFGEGTDSYREILSAIGEFFGADTSSLKITGGSTANNSNNPFNPGSGVNVDGTVEAGIWHHQWLTYNADGSYDKSQSVSFNLRNNVNLATELAAEINALRLKAQQVRTSANNYAGDANATDVANALDNDADILESQLAALDAGTLVNFLDVNPILATTGNVHVTGDYLTGGAGGKLEAPGDVRIDIDNKSTRFMTTNTLTIPDDDGGQVTFNGLRVSSADAINARNSSGKSTSITVVDADTSPKPVIAIENSNDADTGSPAQLWISGDITNLRGIADAKSHGTIRASANINAETVNIATGGDFIKTYTPGFTHQGGNPISQLGSLPAQREAIEADYIAAITARDCSVPTNCSTTIAGNNVYISGEKLNINGLIQAGLPDRSITIPGTLISSQAGAIAAAKAAYLANPDSAPRYFDLNNPDPASTDIKVRYDLATDRLDLANVRMGGGHMELYGNVFSTGNGELRVQDGYGRIAVVNDTGLDIVINRLDTGPGVEGVIKITDTSKRLLANGSVDQTGASSSGRALVTQIVRIGDTIYTLDNRTVDADGKPNYIVSQRNGRTGTYETTKNRRFNWINGKTTSWTRDDSYITKITWGADWLAPDPGGQPSETSSSSTYTNRLTGDWLTANDFRTGDYNYDHSQYVTPQARNTLAPVRWDTDCIAGVCHSEYVKQTYRYTWTEYDYYHHSLDASKQIKVTFTGYDTSDVNIASSSGKVLLNGMVRSLTGNATINATNGIESLSDNAYILANNVSLNAATGAIGSAARPVQIDLTDADPAKGLVDGTLSAMARDGISVKEISGDLRIAALNATAGDLNVIADRHLMTTTNAGLVILRGNNINLVSLSGGIGTPATAASGGIVTAGSGVTVDTRGSNTVLSASAAGDIRLTEATGDMRVTKIDSRTGDVTLGVVGGSLLDANLVEQEDNKSSTELLALWDNMKLRGNPARAAADQTVANFQKQVENDYKSYWRMRNLRADGNGGFATDAYNAGYSFTLSAAQVSALKNANGWTDADIASYQAEQTAFYHDAHTRFGGGTYNDSFSYTATLQESTALRDGAEWKDSELANSLGAGLFRAVADTEVRIEEANVVGRNITLGTLAGGIGQDAGELLISRSIDPGTLSKEEKLALLTAEKQDVTLTATHIRIRQKKDVDVTASGNLVAEAAGTILIGSEQDLAIEKVKSTQEVRIKTGAGLSNAASGNDAAIESANLVLEAGQGSIGSASKSMVVDVANGSQLIARARNDVYITEKSGDMRISSVYAQQDAVLEAATGAILDGGQDDKLDVQAKNVSLTAATTIGAAGGAAGALEVNVGATGLLNASAPNGVYISSAGQNGNLGSINTTGDFAYHVNVGNLDVLGQVNAGSITLSAGDDISIRGAGSLTATGDISVEAGTDGNGSLQVDAGGTRITAGSALTLIAADDISLNAAALSGGDTRVTAGRDLDLDARLDSNGSTTLVTLAGDLRVGGQLVSEGALSLSSGQHMSVGGLIDAAGNVTLDAVGNLLVDGTVDSGNDLRTRSGGDTQVTGTLIATGTAGIDAGGNLGMTGASLSSGGSTTLTAGNDLTVTGTLVDAERLDATAGAALTLAGTTRVAGDTTLLSGGTTTLGGSLTTGGNLAVRSGTDIVVAGSVQAAGSSLLVAQQNLSITPAGTLTSTGNTSLTASNGNVVINGRVDTPASLQVNAGQDVLVGGSATAGGDTRVEAGRDLVVTGTLASGGNLQLDAGRNMQLDGTVTAASSLTTRTANSQSIGGTVNSQGPVSFVAGDDIAFAGGSLSSASDIVLTAGSDGSGSVLGSASTGTDVTTPATLQVRAPQTIGGAHALQVSSPDVVMQADVIQATVSTPLPLALQVSGMNGSQASLVAMTLDAPAGATFSLLDAYVSTVNTNGPLRVIDGRVGNYASFQTPDYSVRVDAISRLGQSAFDAHAFTMTGTYDLRITPSSAEVGAFIIRSNPLKVVSGFPAGTVTASGTGQDALGALRAAPSSTALQIRTDTAPAAGNVSISGDLFECKGGDSACAGLTASGAQP
ncbi:leukotoxin LktA family filamentous adhesin [Uliginosibacterium sp. H1]|uniref:leukotoxin LktA family filamentous adhesin n=1 Tax=Uliginosibacterium sp. H1 TaxID=3114757 RepID=UPI002E191F1C|nr:leukotoxin LktA family filamentous adhesin [Uliginosibacterium sp. H1]